jgi:hypothetical protein
MLWITSFSFRWQLQEEDEENRNRQRRSWFQNHFIYLSQREVGASSESVC